MELTTQDMTGSPRAYAGLRRSGARGETGSRSASTRKMPHKPKTFNPLGHSGRRASDAEYQRTHADDAARKLRWTARYQKFRRWVRRRSPLCADPFGRHQEDGGPVRGEDLHHIVPVNVAPEKLCEESNARMLCRWCHSRITAMEQRGEQTKHLFPAPANA